jgi:gluconate kinase
METLKEKEEEEISKLVEKIRAGRLVMDTLAQIRSIKTDLERVLYLNLEVNHFYIVKYRGTGTRMNYIVKYIGNNYFIKIYEREPRQSITNFNTRNSREWSIVKGSLNRPMVEGSLNNRIFFIDPSNMDHPSYEVPKGPQSLNNRQLFAKHYVSFYSEVYKIPLFILSPAVIQDLNNRCRVDEKTLNNISKKPNNNGNMTSPNSFLGSNEKILLNYKKIHKILMDYLKRKKNEVTIVTWVSTTGHNMEARLRETNLSENLKKNYSNDNILKLPISNTIDITEGFKIPTLSRISIFATNLKIDNIPVIDKYYYSTINKITNNKYVNGFNKTVIQDETIYIDKKISRQNFYNTTTTIKKKPTLSGIYEKLHEKIMNYLRKTEKPVIITWVSRTGHDMEARLRETNLSENLKKIYSNDNILKLPISNTIDITEGFKIETLTRISVFAKNLKVDGKSIYYFMKNNKVNNNDENLYS